MSRGTAVFDKSTNRISSPAGTSTARVQRFPEFSRASAISFFFFFFLSFSSLFPPLFFTYFRTHTGDKGGREMEVIRLTKGRHEVLI